MASSWKCNRKLCALERICLSNNRNCVKFDSIVGLCFFCSICYWSDKTIFKAVYVINNYNNGHICLMYVNLRKFMVYVIYALLRCARLTEIQGVLGYRHAGRFPPTTYQIQHKIHWITSIVCVLWCDCGVAAHVHVPILHSAYFDDVNQILVPWFGCVNWIFLHKLTRPRKAHLWNSFEKHSFIWHFIRIQFNWHFAESVIIRCHS